MTAPIERYKDAYKNWRYNPFTAADMAVDKEEDHLFIPGSGPFLIQMLELPRKNDPTSVTVYCYDDVADFTEVATTPAQGEYRVDYPPEDGEGTGLIEFNNLDSGKEVKVNYKATGSPALAEFLDTKVSYPATTPSEHQILGFVSGAPEWRYNPVCYFHDDNVIYHTSGEDESCMLFRFKRSAKQATVKLELKGAKLHQGFYTELPSHTHTVGTLAVVSSGAHTHGIGTLSAVAVGDHNHAKGTLATQTGGEDHTHAVGTLVVGNESAHTHAKGTIATSNESAHTHAKGTIATSSEGVHTHTVGTLAAVAVGNHAHAKGTLTGSQPNHDHTVSGNTANANLAHTHSSGGYGTDNEDVHLHGGIESGTSSSGNAGAHSHDVTGDSGVWSIANLHQHTISFNTGNAGNEAVTIAGNTADGGGHGHTISGASAAGSAHSHAVTGTTAAGSAHSHAVTGTTAAGSAHAHGLSGSTGSGGEAHTHTIVGNVADAGGHGHTISGATASDGAHVHNLSGSSASAGVAAKTYPDQLKVYVNGVDKTTEILALTALTQFGNGTAGHAFVTTGSGEMDISSLITSAGIHELKVTEPTSGKGGRCLLHLEVT